MIERILSAQFKTISELAISSIIEVSKYLELKTEFEVCSNVYSNINLNGQERLLEICKNEKIKTYINPIGGMELYSKNVFFEENIELFFIKTNKSIYKQFSENFVPFLSIIDVLMFNDIDEIKLQLDNFSLI